MKKDLSRRKFLQRTAGAASALAAANTFFLRDARLEAASYPRVAPSDRLRFGIIGIGMQGSGLLTAAVALPGAECIAAADLYDGRIANLDKNGIAIQVVSHSPNANL